LILAMAALVFTTFLTAAPFNDILFCAKMIKIKPKKDNDLV